MQIMNHVNSRNVNHVDSWGEEDGMNMGSLNMNSTDISHYFQDSGFRTEIIRVRSAIFKEVRKPGRSMYLILIYLKLIASGCISAVFTNAISSLPFMLHSWTLLICVSTIKLSKMYSIFVTVSGEACIFFYHDSNFFIFSRKKKFFFEDKWQRKFKSYKIYVLPYDLLFYVIWN